MADTSAVKTLKPCVPNRFCLFLLSNGNCHCDCRLQEECNYRTIEIVRKIQIDDFRLLRMGNKYYRQAYINYTLQVVSVRKCKFLKILISFAILSFAATFKILLFHDANMKEIYHRYNWMRRNRRSSSDATLN